MPDLKISTPKGKLYLDNKKQAYLEFDNTYWNNFNNSMNRVQMFLDETVANHLMAYVSFDTGVQQKSIPISSDYGSGFVNINVPYAQYQAYSKRIKKRDGKRGTQPFERMVSDNKSKILKAVEQYSRREIDG